MMCLLVIINLNLFPDRTNLIKLDILYINILSSQPFQILIMYQNKLPILGPTNISFKMTIFQLFYCIQTILGIFWLFQQTSPVTEKLKPIAFNETLADLMDLFFNDFSRVNKSQNVQNQKGNY